MIHHEIIEAKLAPKDDNLPGRFDVIEDDGTYLVYRADGAEKLSEHDTLHPAIAAAQAAADDFDKRQIEDLKRNWRNDPSWDIETTEGYEDFQQELYIYRLEVERDDAREQLRRINAALAAFADLLPSRS